MRSHVASSDRDVPQEGQQGYADLVWDISSSNCCDKGNRIGSCFIDRALVADIGVEPITDCEGRVVSKRI